VPGLQRREPAVPDEEGGNLDVEDHGQLETEGVHLNAVDQQLDGGIVGRGDPVRTELNEVFPAGCLPGLPGRLDQPFTRAPGVDEHVAQVQVEQARGDRRELLLGCLAALPCQSRQIPVASAHDVVFGQHVLDPGGVVFGPAAEQEGSDTQAGLRGCRCHRAVTSSYCWCPRWSKCGSSPTDTGTAPGRCSTSADGGPAEPATTRRCFLTQPRPRRPCTSHSAAKARPAPVPPASATGAHRPPVCREGFGAGEPGELGDVVVPECAGLGDGELGGDVTANGSTAMAAEGPPAG